MGRAHGGAGRARPGSTTRSVDRSFGTNAKARISGFPDGLVKLVFRVPDKLLLGVHIVGELASELVHIGQFVLHEGGTIDRFIDATFAVPTRSEAYKYAAYDGLMRLARRPGPRTAAPALSREDERWGMTAWSGAARHSYPMARCSRRSTRKPWQDIWRHARPRRYAAGDVICPRAPEPTACWCCSAAPPTST